MHSSGRLSDTQVESGCYLVAVGYPIGIGGLLDSLLVRDSPALTDGYRIALGYLSTRKPSGRGGTGKSELGRVSLFPHQLQVLLLVQLQPDSATAVGDGVFHSLASLKVHAVAAALGQFKELGLFLERYSARERGFQVFFQELTMPALAQHEEHVDPALR